MVIVSLIAIGCSKTTKEGSGEAQPEVFLVSDFKELTTLGVPQRTIDFGEAIRGDTVMIDFAVNNSGKHPLFIEDAMVDCSCMKPIYPASLAVGVSDTITVRFLTHDYLGKIRKHVVIKSNIEGKFTKLSFFGNVIESGR